MNVHFIDWIIAGLFLISLTMGGWACRFFVRDVTGFVVAGRHMRKFLGLSTHTAESLGIISFAGLMEAGFKDGFSYVGVSVIHILIVPIIYGCTGFVVDRYREAKVVTTAEYAERRYSKGVRITTAAVLSFAGIVNLAIFPIMASRFLTHFLGVSDTTILGMPVVPALMGILLGIALLFACCGGLVSVLLTDFIQSVLIAVMLFIVTGLMIADTGASQIFDTVRNEIGERGFSPLKSETFGPLFLTWMVLQQIVGFPSFAPTMQRIAATDSAKTARQFTMLSWLFGQGRGLMMMTWGVAALAIMGTAAPEGMDEALYPKVVGAMYLGEHLLPPVIFGIVLAALLAAFISTVDSYMLTNATLIVNDVICTSRKKPISARAQLWLLKIVLTIIAIFLFIFGIIYQPRESILEYLILTGTMMQGAGIILIGGLYWKRGSTVGAYVTVIACCLIPVADLVLRRLYEEGYPLKPAHAGLIGIIGSSLLYVTFSLLFPGKRREAGGES